MKKIFTLITVGLLCYLPASSQWVAQPSNLTTGLYAQYVDAVDSNVVWALAANPANQSTAVQQFTKTVDGGQLWIANPINNATGLAPSGICAISADTAWVAMFHPTSGGGRILRTTDGGVNWVWQSTATFAAPNGFPNWVHFFDPLNGICMGDPNGGYFELYTTGDGGNTWTRVPQGNIPANLSGEFGITNVYTAYGDSTVWFGTNLGRILKTGDRGLTWTVANTPYAGEYIGDIAFRDAMNGIASKGSAPTTDVIRTTDGGATWNLVTTNTANIGYKLLSSVPGADSTYFLSSPVAGGGTAFSLNDGSTWVPVDNLIHSDVDFVSPTAGWTGSNELNAPMFKWVGALQANCVAFTGPLQFASPDSICTIDSVVYSIHIDRTADVAMRIGFKAYIFDENYVLLNTQAVSNLVTAGFPNSFVPDAGQTDIGTFTFTIFFTLAPTSEIVHFGIQAFPTQCIDDTSNTLINSVFQNINTCAQTVPGVGTLTLDLSNCPQTGLVTYNVSHSYNGFPPIPSDVFNCGAFNGQAIVTFYVDNGVCVKTVVDTIVCTTGLNDLPENSISLFPNPANDLLFVNAGAEVQLSLLEIFDITGRVVYSMVPATANGTLSVPVAQLASGAWFIRITTADGYPIVRKFIRE